MSTRRFSNPETASGLIMPFPAGSAAAPSVSIRDPDMGFYSEAPDQISGALNGVRRLAFYDTGTVVSLRVGDIDTTLNPNAAFVMRRQGAGGANILAISDNAGVAVIGSTTYGGVNFPIFQGTNGRGTQLAPTPPLTNDILLSLTGAAFVDFLTARVGANMSITAIAAAPSTSDMQSRIAFSACGPASIVLTEIVRLEAATGLSMYGANPIIDQNRLLRFRNYTVATAPSPVGIAGAAIYVTNPTAGAARPYWSNGVNWFDAAGVLLA